MPKKSSGRHSKKSSGKLPAQKPIKGLKKKSTVEFTIKNIEKRLNTATQAKEILFFLDHKMPNVEVRLKAAHAAKYAKFSKQAEYDKLVKGLLQSLRIDPSYRVRSFVASALGKLAGRDALVQLEKFIEMTKPDFHKITNPKDKEKWQAKGEMLMAMTSARVAIKDIEGRIKK